MTETLQQIYDRIPKLECQGKCQDCCGVIPLMPAERERILAAGHSIPTTVNSPKWGDLTCSALTLKGQCSIYEHRPTVCRLWGVVKAMQCPYGCKPSQWLTSAEGHQLIGKVMKLKVKGAFTLVVSPPASPDRTQP